MGELMLQFKTIEAVFGKGVDCVAQDQTHVLGIAPYEGMKLAMEREAEAFPDLHLDVRTGDLEAGAGIVQELPAGIYDCIISRGGTAQLIRRITDIPVVEIQLSVYDVLRAIKLAGNYSDRYAIVGFPSVTEPAHILCDLLRYNIDILTVYSAEDASEVLKRLKENGYRMVVGDMVTHTLARQMGLDAFLVTSGAEALRAALEQAITIGSRSRSLRQENLFLSSIARSKHDHVLVLDQEGALFYCFPAEPPQALLEAFRDKMAGISPESSMTFYHNERDQLYTVTARVLILGTTRYFLFHYRAAQIALRANKAGLRFFNKIECAHLFAGSFYNISGAMGEVETVLPAIASIRQPVMILGEIGTGKEQIARALYLRSPLSSHPFVVADCSVMNDKSWDFLLNHYSSPLNATDNTIYFQHFEAIPSRRQLELMSVIQETGLPKRDRLIFSCTCTENSPPDAGRLFSAKLGCMVLRLPTLRSRADEIPSLANRYLAGLNLELGKQISGFDPRAMEHLCAYDWPGNYTQFKGVLYELAALAASSYIRSSAVAELLSRERSLNRDHTPPTITFPQNQTLDQIIRGAILQAVSANHGNQTAAAQQLGISRTTLWRYLKQKESVSPRSERTPPHGRRSLPRTAYDAEASGGSGPD